MRLALAALAMLLWAWIMDPVVKRYPWWHAWRRVRDERRRKP